MDRFKHVRMCPSLHMEIVCQTGRYKDSEIKHYICFTSKHGHLIKVLVTSKKDTFFFSKVWSSLLIEYK